MQASVLNGGGIVHICVTGSVVPVVLMDGPFGKAFKSHDIGLVY